MNWAKVGNIVGQSLPVLGTVLGGAPGAQVGGLIASALGVNNDPEAVAAAIASPEKMADLRRWAYEHAEKLERLALETLQAELSDKANARAAHRHSPMPAIITGLLTVIVGGLLWALFLAELPAANREVAFMLFGQASALWGASVTYWVGTTRSSADKTRLIGRA